MGNTYSNTAIFSKDFDEVINFIQGPDCPRSNDSSEYLYASTSIEGWTLIFASDDDPEFNYILAQAISERLQVPALYSSVYASDQLEMWFFDRGKEVYALQTQHGEVAEKGDKTELKNIFNCDIRPFEQLGKTCQNFSFVEDIHIKLLVDSKLPAPLGNFCFRDLEEVDVAEDEELFDSSSSVSYFKLYFHSDLPPDSDEVNEEETPQSNASVESAKNEAERLLGTLNEERIDRFPKALKTLIIEPAAKIIGTGAAIRLTEWLVKKYPDDEFAQLLLVRFEYSRRNYNRAEEHAATLLAIDPHFAEALHYLARIYLATDRKEKAFKYFEKTGAASFYSYDTRFQCCLERAEFHCGEEDYRKSQVLVENVLQLPPPFLGKKQLLWRAYYLLGYCSSWMGDFDKGVENFEKAIEIRPMNWEAYQGMALIFLTLEQYEQVMSILENFPGKLTEVQKKVYENIHNKAQGGSVGQESVQT